MRQGNGVEEHGGAQATKAPHGDARHLGLQGTPGLGVQGERYGGSSRNLRRDEGEGDQTGSLGEFF